MNTDFDQKIKFLMKNKDKFLSKVENFEKTMIKNYYYNEISDKYHVYFFKITIFTTIIAAMFYFLNNISFNYSYLTVMYFTLAPIAASSALLVLLIAILVILDAEDSDLLHKKEYRIIFNTDEGKIVIFNKDYYFQDQKVTDKEAIANLKILAKESLDKIFTDAKDFLEKNSKEKKKETKTVSNINEEIKQAIFKKFEKEEKAKKESSLKNLEKFLKENDIDLSQLKDLALQSEKIEQLNKENVI